MTFLGSLQALIWFGALGWAALLLFSDDHSFEERFTYLIRKDKLTCFLLTYVASGFVAWFFLVFLTQTEPDGGILLIWNVLNLISAAITTGILHGGHESSQ